MLLVLTWCIPEDQHTNTHTQMHALKSIKFLMKHDAEDDAAINSLVLCL